MGVTYVLRSACGVLSALCESHSHGGGGRAGTRKASFSHLPDIK